MITDNSNGKVIATYLYPFLVTSVAQFQLETVARRMGAKEINIMEDSFLEVIGATVAAIEGDTETTDIKFIYQDLMQSDANVTLSPYTLSADFKIHGICRECSSLEFAGVVNVVIGANLEAYKLRLKANGELAETDFFRSVNEVNFAVPQLPDDLPPIDDGSIYDSLPPSTNTTLPIVLFSFGIVTLVSILLGGSYFIWREVKEDTEYDKDDDEFSTESESAGEYSINMDSGSGMEVEEYDMEDVDNSKKALDEYQVETVLSTEDGGMGDNQLIRSVTQTFSRIPSQRSSQKQHRSSRGYIDPAGRVLYSSNQQSTPRKAAISEYETYAW